MSRDSSGESLEAILASIRRSLSEQTTSVLEEEAVAPVELLPSSDASSDLDMPPIPASLAQRLGAAPDARRGASTGPSREAAAIAEAPAARRGGGNRGGSSDSDVMPTAAVSPVNAHEPHELTVAPPRAAAVVEAFAAGPAARAEAGSCGLPRCRADAGTEGPAVVSEPGAWAARPPRNRRARLRRPSRSRRAPPTRSRRVWGVARGPLAPFFGSSAEVVKVGFVAVDPPVRQGPEAVASLSRATGGSPALDGSRTLNRGDAGRPGRPAGGWTARRVCERARSFRGSARRCPDGSGPARRRSRRYRRWRPWSPSCCGPMLRRWLDENMPRLVSAALKAEADVMAGRDPGRSAIPRSLELSAAAA